MHIAQDLKCNKDFVNAIEGWYALGLAYVAEKVSSTEGLLRSNLAPTPWVDEPSLKLDQHESSHSCALHLINDALLNMMDYMP